MRLTNLPPPATLLFKLVLGTLFTMACAKVGDPLPPLKPLGTTSDLRLRTSGNRLQLEFSLPPGEVSVVEVVMACGNDNPPEDEYQLLARIERRRLLPAPAPGAFGIVTPRQPVSPCYYIIRFEDPAGNKSESSNRVRTP